ncbi:MAG: HlyC/CorC family transporter [Rhodospirillaceae bacterium]|jgi:CBS domain containing-hemolysin-like protein|nr:HlyC/CorC family transporter [Rhodospirillaceae bacterium]
MSDSAQLEARARAHAARDDTVPPARGIRGWLRRVFRQRNGADLRDTIEELIDEQEEAGELPATSDELTLLRNILNLHGLTVYDIMVPRADIVSVDIDVSLEEMVRLMSEEAHSRIPVFRGTLDEIEGMVHIKDVLACWNLEQPVHLKDIVRRVLFVAPSMPILELLLQMRVTRVHLALVVDEFGGIDGMATIEDLVEEIVGEIEDEHDEDDTPSMTKRPDGSFDADARVPLKDFEDRLGAILNDEEREEDIDTIGGLVFFLAGRVPVRGEIIRHESGVEFEILDADPRRLRRLRVCVSDHSADRPE